MHDQSHEDRCLRLSAGELSAGEAAQARQCAECRSQLETLRQASDWAARAAVALPAGLNERVAGRLERRSAPALKWAALALAALAVTLYIPRLRQDRASELHWSNGLERDMARADAALERLSRSMVAESEALELDEDLKDLDRSMRSLGRQVGKNARL